MPEVGRLLGVCALLLASSTVDSMDGVTTPSSAWSENFQARVEALALLQTLHADLLSNSSATLTLEHWCDVHHLAAPPTVVAERVLDMDKPASPAQRRELAVTDTETVRYRRVRLRCGNAVLSEADNWYVPGRLSPEMNRLLETTDTPFGKAVQSLHFQRHTLSSTLLWRPLPDGWEMQAKAARAPAAPMPRHLLENEAVLSLPDGTPFSEVVESYTNEVLGFPVPVAR
jgi:chorismate-pyruvate lyase